MLFLLLFIANEGKYCMSIHSAIHLQFLTIRKASTPPRRFTIPLAVFTFTCPFAPEKKCNLVALVKIKFHKESRDEK